MSEVIGRTDLLTQISRGSPNLDDLDLNPLLVQADPGTNKRYCEQKIINKVPDTLDEKIWLDIKDKFSGDKKISLSYNSKNTYRAIGTRLSHYVYKKFGKDKLDDDIIEIRLNGSAGQSLGAFLSKGIKILVEGDSNDYVGKGLSGGKIVIRPPKNSNLISKKNVIIGNTVLYGATKGKIFARGQAGERFAVRNSGGIAVVEGCGSNGCEYMTGGIVAILGDVSDNFAAGMTGGMAFVYDPENKFENFVNNESVVYQIPESLYWIDQLKKLIEEYYEETSSEIAGTILNNFLSEIKKFKQVCPIEMLDKLENPISLKTSKSKSA